VAGRNDVGAGRIDVGAGFSRPVTVTLATPNQDDLWTRVVSEGFVAFEPLAGGAPEGKPLTIEQMIEMMSQFKHPQIRRYIAWVEGQPAGGGAAWAHEGVLGIFGTSTLPQFRRRGLQAAVTIHAIREAHGSADLAIATTAPGSTSQRTFERLGFSVLYTRAVFVRN
jgi:GNAT superfamily N-acetyltransferase